MTIRLDDSETDTEEMAENISLPENVVSINAKSIFAPEKEQKGLAIAHQRWAGSKIPFGYAVKDEGLIKLTEDKPAGEVIAGPIFPISRTMAPGGGNCGLVIELQTLEEDYSIVPIPRERLYDDPGILARDLARIGFFIQTGKEKDLLRFLANCRPEDKRMAVVQTGWAQSTDDHLVYVLPNTATEEGYHFQPERFNPSNYSVRPSGNLSDWTNNVFDASPYPLFAVLASLSGPLLKAAQIDSGGFHFFGGSSSGKTTLAQIAASVWGNGSDPADAPANPYIKRWNSTLNAMEALCAAHNDMTLILDELGSCNSKDFGRAVYDIAGGQGKSAMDASRNLRNPRSWRLTLISTGEISSRNKIEEGLVGKNNQAKAGQLLRLIDVEIRDDMFDNADQVNKIKRQCSKFFGTLGPAYIQAIVEKLSETALRDAIQPAMDRAMTRIMASRGKLESVQQRALRRFALAETAGHLLVYLKLVPGLTNEIVKNCIDLVVDQWMPSSIQLSDTERSITNLRAFILANKDARFKDIASYDSKDKLSREIAGYYDAVKETYFLLPAAFREATGAEPTIMAKELKQRGLLRIEHRDRLTYRITLGGNRVYTYGIKQSLLGDKSDDTDQERGNDD